MRSPVGADDDTAVVVLSMLLSTSRSEPLSKTEPSGEEEEVGASMPASLSVGDDEGDVVAVGSRVGVHVVGPITDCGVMVGDDDDGCGDVETLGVAGELGAAVVVVIVGPDDGDVVVGTGVVDPKGNDSLGRGVIGAGVGWSLVGSDLVGRRVGLGVAGGLVGLRDGCGVAGGRVGRRVGRGVGSAVTGAKEGALVGGGTGTGATGAGVGGGFSGMIQLQFPPTT